MVLEGSGGGLDGDLEGRRADEKDETDSCITAIHPPQGWRMHLQRCFGLSG